jgi:hypothetical protein
MEGKSGNDAGTSSTDPEPSSTPTPVTFKYVPPRIDDEYYQAAIPELRPLKSKRDGLYIFLFISKTLLIHCVDEYRDVCSDYRVSSNTVDNMPECSGTTSVALSTSTSNLVFLLFRISYLVPKPNGIHIT